MRKFRFSLQRLLDIRRHREKEWEWKLAAATGACVLTRDQIESRRRDELRTLKERGLFTHVVDINDLYSRDMYQQRMLVEIHSLTAILAENEAKRQAVQTRYVTASQKRKALDKLRERREADHRKQQRREESKDLDDINNGSGARSRVGEE